MAVDKTPHICEPISGISNGGGVGVGGGDPKGDTYADKCVDRAKYKNISSGS